MPSSACLALTGLLVAFGLLLTLGVDAAPGQSASVRAQGRSAREVYDEHRSGISGPGLYRWEDWIFSVHEEPSEGWDDPDLVALQAESCQVSAVGLLPAAFLAPDELAARAAPGHRPAVLAVAARLLGKPGVELASLEFLETVTVGPVVRATVAVDRKSFEPSLAFDQFLARWMVAVLADQPGMEPLVFFELCAGVDSDRVWPAVRRYITAQWGPGVEASLTGQPLVGLGKGWLILGPELSAADLSEMDIPTLLGLAGLRSHDSALLMTLAQGLEASRFPRLANHMRRASQLRATVPGEVVGLASLLLVERRDLKAWQAQLASPVAQAMIGTHGRLPLSMSSRSLPYGALSLLLGGTVPANTPAAIRLLDSNLQDPPDRESVVELARLLNNLGAPATAYTLARQALLSTSSATPAAPFPVGALREALRSLKALGQPAAASSLLQVLPPSYSSQGNTLLEHLLAWARG
ncbi:MAG TPA: hypothetical protein EYQ59_06920 [Planctomycetes bacterium]|jgi:hypothetical protein|nr:hypothetical protein [Planctomycetota bacterium]